MKPQTLNEIFFRIVNRRQERLMLFRGALRGFPLVPRSFTGVWPEWPGH